MLGPVSRSESPYRKNLKEIARIAQYEPIASIPQPSRGFNYTIVRRSIAIQAIATVTTRIMKKW
jgi:hypothetical protein